MLIILSERGHTGGLKAVSHNHMLVFIVSHFLEESVCQGILYRNTFLGVQRQQPLQQILRIVVEVVATSNALLHPCDFLEINSFVQFFGKFQFISKVATLVDHLTAEEVGQFQDVVDVVKTLDVGWLVYHADVVEDVVFARHELEEDNSDWPQVRLVALVLMVHNRLQRHIRFCAYFVLANYLEAFC
mgnify:FL=1